MIQDYFLVKLILIFLMGLIFSVLINRIFLRFSKNLGIRNIDDKVIRWKTTSKPAFGGIALYIVFLLLLAIYPIFFSKHNDSFDIKLIGFVVASTFGFLAGLTDDAYNTNPLLKSLAQAACALILIFTGTYIDIFDTLWINYTISFIWIVGMMNSINMLDNMDAITTVSSIFALIGMLTIIFFSKQYDNVYFVIVIGSIAALLGFLFFNWYPSKMYMGDTGSQFLGVLLAALSINYLWNYSTLNEVNITRQFLFPILAFLVPLSDTTTVVINRMMKGKSPFVGGRDHTTHHLSYLGLSEPSIAFLVAGIGLVSSLLILMSLSIDPWSHLFTILFLAYAITVFLSLFLVTKKTHPENSDKNDKKEK